MSLLDIKIGVPSDFQAIERDIIIISHVRNSQQHQLGEFGSSTSGASMADSNESTKVFNLALTRAKQFLWFIGNLS